MPIEVAKALGRAGEMRRGIDVSLPKRSIESLTGTAARRYPDRITDTAIEEVKNRKTVYNSAQLRDYAMWAKRTSRDFDLIVRENTHVSRNLWKMAGENRRFNILKLLPRR
ncbi:MAG TPA: putative toxin [Chloroflexota bacterium]|nr:putative toxin [Chloroflexota bacterium]